MIMTKNFAKKSPPFGGGGGVTHRSILYSGISRQLHIRKQLLIFFVQVLCHFLVVVCCQNAHIVCGGWMWVHIILYICQKMKRSLGVLLNAIHSINQEKKDYIKTSDTLLHI